jgi:hypothetical protein
MSSKPSKGHEGWGDFIDPLIDLLAQMIIFAGKGLYIAGAWLFSRYAGEKFRGKDVIKKIDRKELKNQRSTKSVDALGYSITNKRDIKMSELDRRRHTLLVGASGYGKTVLLDDLIYDDLVQVKPVIFIDPKGDQKSLEQFINLCRITGREFEVFSEYYQGEGAISLNPVKEGSATHIADRIHTAFTWSEEHYANCCYDALKSACNVLINSNQVVTLSKLHRIIVEESEPKSFDAIFDRKEVSGIISRLDKIIDSDFGAKLEGEGLSFKEVWSNQKCVYIGLPVLGYPMSARSLGKIIMGDLAHAVYQKYRNASSKEAIEQGAIGVYIDELSAVITEEFIELLNKCRGAQMELTFAFQSPSDLEKVSPELKSQVFENANNWFILKQRMASAATELSEAIGTKAGAKQTLRVESGVKQDQGSTRDVEELIAHPNIIKNLSPGQCILLRQGPVKIDLINIKYMSPEIVANNVEILKTIGLVRKQPVLVKVIEQKQETIPFHKTTGGQSGEKNPDLGE